MYLWSPSFLGEYVTGITSEAAVGLRWRMRTRTMIGRATGRWPEGSEPGKRLQDVMRRHDDKSLD
jgi:hypothetical protein